jgi:nucleotide-binding universal stress UspA family protein
MAAAGWTELHLPGTGNDNHDRPRRHRRILVPIDQFGHSARALPAAVSICDEMGGQLRLVHVRTWDGGMVKGGGRFFIETTEAATAVLARQLDLAWEQGAQASGVVVDGHRTRIGSVIADQARGWGADAIVLARRHRNPLGVLLLGSVTDQVLRAAKCPVLIVRQERR